MLGAAGAALRERREELGLPLSHIATRVNVSVVHLSEVERGRKGASASVLEEVALVLGLDVAQVLCAFRVVPDRIAAAFFNAERMRDALGACISRPWWELDGAVAMDESPDENDPLQDEGEF